jgi:hypothetical protein
LRNFAFKKPIPIQSNGISIGIGNGKFIARIKAYSAIDVRTPRITNEITFEKSHTFRIAA